MKLAQCILAFEKGIEDSNRPEDRNLASKYLTQLSVLLAKVVEKKEIKNDIQSIDRLLGQTWIVDELPFKEAFKTWKESKADLLDEIQQ